MLLFPSPAATAKPGSPILAKPSARCSAIRKRTHLGPARRYRSKFKVLLPSLTVFFPALPMTRFSLEILKINRSTPIVAETEQIMNRRNFLLKSRAQIYDGSGSRSLTTIENICAGKSVRYHDLK